MSDGLVAFLRDCLDEDQAVALAANRLPGDRTGSRWETDLYYERHHAAGELDAWCERYWAIRTPMSDGRGVCELVGSGQDGGGIHTAEVADHTARHNPARILAEVEAKRRIVDRHAPQLRRHGWYCAHDRDEWPCADIRDLAAPYADRPGYQQEWRP